MRIRLIAAGTRMPDWVVRGYEEYARRLPRDCRLELVEIPTSKRDKGAAPDDARAREGQRMLAAAGAQARIIALDEAGDQPSTEELAGKLQRWMLDGTAPALLVGGPDGLAPECLARAQERWCLSKLTLPHALVRVIIAEQIYRAWSVLAGHPYHRG